MTLLCAQTIVMMVLARIIHQDSAAKVPWGGRGSKETGENKQIRAGWEHLSLKGETKAKQRRWYSGKSRQRGARAARWLWGWSTWPKTQTATRPSRRDDDNNNNTNNPGPLNLETEWNSYLPYWPLWAYFDFWETFVRSSTAGSGHNLGNQTGSADLWSPAGELKAGGERFASAGPEPCCRSGKTT